MNIVVDITRVVGGILKIPIADNQGYNIIPSKPRILQRLARISTPTRQNASQLQYIYIDRGVAITEVANNLVLVNNQYTHGFDAVITYNYILY